MKHWIAGLLLVPFALWLASAPPELQEPLTFWSTRHALIPLLGLLAYVFMTAGLLLAQRPAWLERRIGGLDRVYRLHKWIGIGAGALLFSHWMMEIVPKAMAKAGWITRPVKQGGAKPERFFEAWREASTEVGEWVAYIALAMVFIALVRRIPYHWFQKLHKVFPVLFLAITFHAIVLLPDALWPTPTGLLVGACALAGGIAALRSLAGRIGRARRTTGTVEQVERLEGVLGVTCLLDGPGIAYRPGQFAYLRFAGGDGPHPFTIASCDAHDARHRLRFYIKTLGDATRRLHGQLQPGCQVAIEGPYGCFDFEDTQRQAEQIWIAGGIGITPFLARLDHLASRRGEHAPGPAGAPPIGADAPHFFFCTEDGDPLLPRVRALCEQAGVVLHVVRRADGGGMTLDKALAGIERPRQARLWFCGPQGLGDKLEGAWRALGLPRRAFRRELFAMR